MSIFYLSLQDLHNMSPQFLKPFNRAVYSDNTYQGDVYKGNSADEKPDNQVYIFQGANPAGEPVEEFFAVFSSVSTAGYFVVEHFVIPAIRKAITGIRLNPVLPELDTELFIEGLSHSLTHIAFDQLKVFTGTPYGYMARDDAKTLYALSKFTQDKAYRADISYSYDPDDPEDLFKGEAIILKIDRAVFNKVTGIK